MENKNDSQMSIPPVETLDLTDIRIGESRLVMADPPWIFLQRPTDRYDTDRKTQTTKDTYSNHQAMTEDEQIRNINLIIKAMEEEP